MRATPLVLAVALVATALALPAASASPPFVTTVASGDADAGAGTTSVFVGVGLVDANGNGMLDVEDPDETLYFDLDNDHAPSYGDLRLTKYAAYPAGTAVDYTNRDFGRPLRNLQGWFARDASGQWFYDSDGNRAISPGDVRLGAAPGTKVRAGDADLAAPLTTAQTGINSASRVAWRDANGNGKHDLAEPWYLDLDGDGRVAAGDVRFLPSGFGIDDEATRAELAAAVAQLEAKHAELAARDAALARAQQDGDATLAGQLAALGDELASQGLWLLLLGLFTVAGLVAVAWYARTLHARAGAPAPQHAQRKDSGLL